MVYTYYMQIVKQIISAHLEIPEDAISEDAQITEEPGADSLVVVDMLVTLEDTLGISIPDEDVEALRTPSDIASYLASREG